MFVYRAVRALKIAFGKSVHLARACAPGAETDRSHEESAVCQKIPAVLQKAEGSPEFGV
jgi:hypothetical protein